MRATLEFNLPDEEYEFSLAINAREMWSALIDIQQDVRAIYKWEDLDEREFAIVERIYLMINENVSNIKLTQ